MWNRFHIALPEIKSRSRMKRRFPSNVTIRQIAQHAGCSPATVSRALSGNGYSSSEAKRRVMSAIHELGYAPNYVARGLARGHLDMIAFIVPDISNPFFPTLAREVEKVAWERGFVVVLCNTEGDASQEQRYLRTLAGHLVAGLLFSRSSLVPKGQGEDPLLAVARRTPTVTLDRLLDGVDGVLFDDYQAGYAATEHLTQLGHRRVAVIAGPLEVPAAAARLRAFRDCLIAHHITPESKYSGEGDFSLESGFHCAMELLHLAPPPTAVFATNDLMAIGVIQAASKLGLSVPSDVSVVGLDDIPLASAIPPGLTTVRVPMAKMAALGADCLCNRIQGTAEQGSRHHLLSGELIIRGSTALAPGD